MGGLLFTVIVNNDDLEMSVCGLFENTAHAARQEIAAVLSRNDDADAELGIEGVSDRPKGETRCRYNLGVDPTSAKMIADCVSRADCRSPFAQVGSIRRPGGPAGVK